MHVEVAVRSRHSGTSPVLSRVAVSHFQAKRSPRIGVDGATQCSRPACHDGAKCAVVTEVSKGVRNSLSYRLLIGK